MGRYSPSVRPRSNDRAEEMIQRGAASLYQVDQNRKDRAAEEAERELERRLAEARLEQLERARIKDEAESARGGLALPGVERVPGREVPKVGDQEVSIFEGEAPTLPGVAGGEPSDPFFEGAELGGPGREPSIDPGFERRAPDRTGDAIGRRMPDRTGDRIGRRSFDARPELDQPRNVTDMDERGLRGAFSRELQAAASAPPGAEPDVEPGAFDPETGDFTTEPIFRDPAQADQGPTVGEFLREGRVESRPESFRLSTGQEIVPGQRAEQALAEEIEAILAARPDLSRPEARMLATGQEGVLTFGREPEDELDRTFNVSGREFETLEEAAEARERLGIGGGTEGRLTQTQRTARQFGFDNVADYRRFEDRMGDLQEVYGNTQGDPLLQRAVEARARGLSESEVLNRVLEDARASGFSPEEVEAVEADVRAFFSQRTRRQIDQLQSGNLGDFPTEGSGFDLEFRTRRDTAREEEGGGRRGIGAARDGGR